MAEVADQRLHRETRERPWTDSNQKRCGRCRSFLTTIANPPKRWFIKISGSRSRATVTACRTATLAGGSADSSSVTIDDRMEEAVSCARSWRRGQTFGAERFEKILAEERPAARRSQAQQRLLDSLDGLCSRSLVEAYLRDLADTDRSLGRQSRSFWN